jgi:hypothetical protein
MALLCVLAPLRENESLTNRGGLCDFARIWRNFKTHASGYLNTFPRHSRERR